MSQTQLLGTLQDSGSSPLEGQMIVTLDAPIYLETPDPDATNFEVSRIFNITLGAVDITLEESETAGVTYRFQFFQSDGQGGFLSTSLFDFHAVVPDTSLGNGTYQFSLLTPTGITTTSLSTSAIVVARQMLINPVLSQFIADSLNIYRQDAEPDTPTDKQIWIRPTSGQIWFYDTLISAWKSEIKTSSFSGRSNSVDGVIEGEIDWLSNFPTIRLERVLIRATVAGINDGTNNWNVLGGFYELNNLSPTPKTGVVNTDQLSGADLVSDTVPIQLSRSTVESFSVEFNRNGSPGNLNVSGHFGYRFLFS